MTAREMLPTIGTLVYLQASSLQVTCLVTNIKNAYGQLRFELEPCTGKGRAWVNASNVTPLSNAEAREVVK